MVNFYLIWTAFVLVLLLLTYYTLKRRHLYKATWNMKGPIAYPIIGNGLMFLGSTETVLYKLSNVFKFEEKTPVRFWLGNKLIIAFRNLDHIEKILSSSKFAHKHEIYEFIKPYLGDGLVSGSGPNHKRHRRIIQPFFNMAFADETVVFMQKHTKLCMEKLEKHIDQGYFDIHHDIHKCMLDFVGEVILGKDWRCQKQGYTKFDIAFIDVYTFGFSRLVKPWLHPNIIYNNSSHKTKHFEIVDALNEGGNEIVANAWKRRKEGTSDKSEIVPIVDRIAAYIEQNPGSIQQQHFVDHMLTLHTASQDTLTIIASFVALCFGMYPEYQDKAAAEVREVLGETPRDITLADLRDLTYLEMCIKDAYRLFPIAPYILRKNLQDFQLENWTIPHGADIIVPIFNMHRDIRYWENPEHFHPDHFLPEKVLKRHVYAYVPFSAGPRGCIGKLLATPSLKIFLSNLLQRFEIEAEGKLPDLPLRMDISVRPLHGYNVKLKKRVWK